MRTVQMLQDMQAAKRATGKSYLSLLLEILELRLRATTQLGASEYFYYGLFDDARFSRDKRRAFAGWRILNPVDDLANDPSWLVFTQDKAVFYAHMEALGLPVPTTQAVFARRPRFLGAKPVLADAQGIRDFLLHHARYPLFIKPIFGIYGQRVHLFRSLNRDAQTLVLADGSAEPLERFVKTLTQPSVSPRDIGYVFQNALFPHPAIRALSGERISGVRVAIVRRDGTPKPWAAVLKLIAGSNIADNFFHGESGNLLGAVDLQSGRLLRVLQGGGLKQTIATVHPDTGAPFADFVIPEWQNVVDLAVKVASAIPGFGMIGCDIAITSEGPVVLEANAPGDIDLLQFANGWGALEDPDIRALAQRAARKRILPFRW